MPLQHQVSLGAAGGGNSSGSSDKEKDPPNEYQRYFSQQSELAKLETEKGLFGNENSSENDFFGTTVSTENIYVGERGLGLTWKTPVGLGLIASRALTTPF